MLTTNSHVLPLIKALRGLPGDDFSMQADQIVVNGRVLINSEGLPYRLSMARVGMLNVYARDYQGVIPPDTFLVMGEVPSGSTDSSVFGLVSRDAIIGRALDP